MLRRAYELCAPSAFRRARELLGNEADAWDAVHKVFCRLAEGDLVERIQARPMLYVYRATTNACLNELAARRVRSHLPVGLHEVAAPRAEEVHARELLEKLDAKLDDFDRRILILSFHDGLPQEQVADVLGVWRRTIGRRLARLRALVAGFERGRLKRTS